MTPAIARRRFDPGSRAKIFASDSDIRDAARPSRPDRPAARPRLLSRPARDADAPPARWARPRGFAARGPRYAGVRARASSATRRPLRLTPCAVLSQYIGAKAVSISDFTAEIAPSGQ